MRKLLTFGVAVALLASCTKGITEELRDVICTESVHCQAIFRQVSAKVIDGQGHPVALSRIKVTRLSNGQDLTRSFDTVTWGMFQNFGNYPIASDADKERLPRDREIPLRFQGYIGTKEVVDAVYVVAFGCCHIELVAGERELVVN